jgi:predicted AlkP superfamily phosphohydrolase/phosphomutase
MFFNTLDRTREDLSACVFDITDRVQHMFWRYLDKSHPANRGKDTERHAGAIAELYRNMDGLVGRTLERLSERDLLIVMSDHGFQPFSRGVNVNSWLHQNGYLALKDGAVESGEWFSNVDWSRTKAYAMGLGGIYINERGREAQGTVAAGDEKRLLKEELVARLSGLRDAERGDIGITQVWDSAILYAGPYLDNAPDLIVGYAAGYRASWDSVTGKISPRVFEDNVMSWSGDHCIDPRLVPGVFFSSKRLEASRQPHIMDIAPTVLAAFGVERPGHMDGTALHFE